MAKNGVNPNTPQFFDSLYNGIWEVGDFKTEWFYEEEERIAFYRRLAELPFFDFSGRILDVGCGMGGVLAQIPGEGMEKYGIDFSATAIEKISRRLVGTFVVGDVHRLPFDTDFFDRIMCTETLEHVDDPTAVMAEMARVLKPGGKLLITVPEHSHDLATEYWPGGVNLHINKYTIFSLKRLLIDADLIVQSAELDHREIWLTAVKAPGACRVSMELGSGLVARETTAAGNLHRVPCQPDALMTQGGAAEREWQYLLKALELDPTDRKALAACAGTLSRNGRIDDQAKLYRAFLEKRPGDPEISRMLAENEAIPRQSREEERRVAERRTLLQTNSRLGPILPDREHLAAAMGWLRRAQEGNAGSGVSALYYQDRGRWEVDSPDNTGTIIPTFLAYARLTGDGRYREWARDMADWELAIQSPEGGAGEPVGVYGLRPRVFNTGQVMLGWVSLYRESGDAGYLAAARRAGDWIVGSLNADGAWRRNTYQGPHPYKSRVSWALLELYAVTGDGKYREGAERSLTWILGQGLDNGWFDNNSLAQPGRPWSHLIAHVLVGLLEICRLGNARCDRERILTLLGNAARGMVSHYLTAKERAGGRFVTLAATFDRTWGSSDPWSCLAGTAQVEFFLRRLARFVDNPQLLMAADMLIDDLKRLQLMEGVDDPLAIGGLHGSYPIEASYCSFAIPSWGVKFFADSLLQRLLPAGDELQAR